VQFVGVRVIVNVHHSVITGNESRGATAEGGGIYALNSTLNVVNSTITFNGANGSVLGEGGGIFDPNSVLNLAGSTVSNNHATTAFYNIGR
jgi:hypothetical protein